MSSQSLSGTHAGSADRKPKLLQVVHHLDLGGSEEVALSLSEQLHEQYEIQFFAVRGVEDTTVGHAMKARLDKLGIPVHSGTRRVLKKGGFLEAAVQLAQTVRRERPDIVHLHTEIPELTHAISQGFIGNASGRAATVTRTLHNTVYWGPWQRIGAQVERRLSEAPCAPCSDAALSGLQVFRSSNGLPPLSAQIARRIYNGVSSPLIQHPQQPVARNRPLKVLSAGRLELQKSVDLLPAILKHAGTLGHPNAELNIYGSGTLQTDLERWVAEGVPGWTINMYPPTPHLRAIMAEHDVLLMPSRFEGLGLLAVEALMAGLPVIGTQVAGLNEVLTEGYPLLAPAEDVEAIGSLLAEVLNDPSHFQAVAQSWIEPTEAKFGVERMGHEYDEFYRHLLRSHSHAGQSWKAKHA